MRLKRPAQVDALLWDRLPRSTRLALMARFAATPEEAAALFYESERLTLAGLQKAVRKLEKVMSKSRGER